jgi:hypothetical protein
MRLAMDGLTIGGLAQRARVSRDTLRFYELAANDIKANGKR